MSVSPCAQPERGAEAQWPMGFELSVDKRPAYEEHTRHELDKSVRTSSVSLSLSCAVSYSTCTSEYANKGTAQYEENHRPCISNQDVHDHQRTRAWRITNYTANTFTGEGVYSFPSTVIVPSSDTTTAASPLNKFDAVSCVEFDICGGRRRLSPWPYRVSLSP